jgi:hypothetical protein
MGNPIDKVLALLPEGNAGLAIKVAVALVGAIWWTSAPGADEARWVVGLRRAAHAEPAGAPGTVNWAPDAAERSAGSRMPPRAWAHVDASAWTSASLAQCILA